MLVCAFESAYLFSLPIAIFAFSFSITSGLPSNQPCMHSLEEMLGIFHSAPLC